MKLPITVPSPEFAALQKFSELCACEKFQLLFPEYQADLFYLAQMIDVMNAACRELEKARADVLHEDPLFSVGNITENITGQSRLPSPLLHAPNCKAILHEETNFASPEILGEGGAV